MKNYFWLSCMLILLFSACALDEFSNVEEVSLDEAPEYAIPLAFADINIADIVGDSSEIEVKVREDGVMIFSYLADERVIPASDIASVDFPNGTVPVFINPFELDFPMQEGQDIDSIVLSQGELNVTYTLTATTGDTIDFYFFFEGLSNQGETFEIRTREVFNSSLPENNNRPFNLEGYILSPNDDDKIRIGYEVRRNGVVDNSVASNVNFQLTNTDYSSIHGYFGEEQTPILSDTIDLEFLSSYTAGSYEFTEPFITMNYENGFGLPMQAIITEFIADNEDGSTSSLTGSYEEEEFLLNYPDTNEIGQIETGQLIFTNENANITEFLGNQPRQIRFAVDGIPNPAKDTNIRGFVLKESEMRIVTDVEIPLIGTLSDFELYDTLSLTGDLDAETIDNFERANLRYSIENGIPLDATVQIYLTDANYVTIDSLLDTSNNTIASAMVNDSGDVTQATTTNADIPISKATYTRIVNDAEFLIARFNINSSDQASQVIIKENQRLKANLGLALKIKL